MKTIYVIFLPKVSRLRAPKNVAWLTLLFFICGLVSWTQAQEPSPEVCKLFAEEEPIEVTLTYDIKNLLKNKYEEEEYWHADFFGKMGEEEFRSSIRIQPRGNFRRKNCFMPPFKAQFQKV